ncbi:MAG: tetratricopeptide repeat protein [Alphaproteobacteria bacterium]|nr:tetratricopeptide repeat protein [Alphaproteobacteria bacterium]
MTLHFIRPEWLYALPIAILPLLAAKQVIKSNNAWERICDTHLLKHLVIGQNEGQNAKRGLLKHITLSALFLLSIIALAGPAWEKIPQPTYKTEKTVVFALNLERTMDINDVTPSRLARAKFKIHDLLNSMKGGQSALVLYTDEPYVATPLSDDAKVLKNILPIVSTSIMPSDYASREGQIRGNNRNVSANETHNGRTDRAINKAVELLENTGNSTGDIIVITDNIGASAGDAMIATKVARDKGYRVSVIGVATKAGAPLPARRGGFEMDNKGNIITSKLSVSELQDIAATGGGEYVDTSMNESVAIKKIINQPIELDALKQRMKEAQAKADTWRDMGIFLVFIPLCLAPLAFRKNWLFALLLGFSLNLSTPAYAADDITNAVNATTTASNKTAVSDNKNINDINNVEESFWDKLWLNQNQRAYKALQNKKAEQAATLFKNENWKGTAQYKAGQYKTAADTFKSLEGEENKYNLGNALAYEGKFQEAIDEYNKVLEQNPNHKDAEFNRDLLKKLMSQQQQNNKSERNKPDEDMQNKDDKNKQDSQNKHNQEDNQNQNNGKNKDDNEQQDDNNNQGSQKQQKKDQQNSSGQNQNQNQDNNQQNNSKQNKNDSNNPDEENNNDDKQNQNSNSQNEENKDNESDDANKQKMQQQKPEIKNSEPPPNGEKQKKTLSEGQQATEQMLGKIPDDPGGLLREKLRRIYTKKRYNQKQ